VHLRDGVVESDERVTAVENAVERTVPV